MRPGTHVSAERKENAINRKQRDNPQRETLAASATKRMSVLPRPLLGQVLGKVRVPEAAVLLEREPEDRAEITSVAVMEILAFSRMSKYNRDANSVQSACSGTKRLTVSPTRSRRKVVEKVLLPC